MCWSLLRPISPSWCDLRYKVSTAVKLFFLILYFLSSFFLSPGHFLGKLCASFPEKLPVGSQLNFTCMLMGSVRIAMQNIIDLTDDLDLTRSQLCKITFWAISRFCWTNRHQILTLDSLYQGLSINQKISWTVWTCDVRECVTFATIKQKDVFDHNVPTNALRMTILAPR